MKVFISWSGNSKDVAQAIADALPRLFDDAEPWMSTQARAGAIWLPDLESKLNDTEFGIVCVTRANARSRWLHYEAGALSRKIGGNNKREILPVMLIDFENVSDIGGPLAGFSLSLASEENFLKMMNSLNDTKAGTKVNKDILAERVTACWPRIKAAVAAVNDDAAPEPGARSQHAMIGEVLEIVRGLAAANNPAAWLSETSSAISDGVSDLILSQLVSRTGTDQMSWTILDQAVTGLAKDLKYSYPPDFMVGVYPEGGFVGYLLWLDSGREWPIVSAPDADQDPLPEEISALGAKIQRLCAGKASPRGLVVDASMKTGSTMARTVEMVRQACARYQISPEIRTLCLTRRHESGSAEREPDFIGSFDPPQFPFEV